MEKRNEERATAERERAPAPPCEATANPTVRIHRHLPGRQNNRTTPLPLSCYHRPEGGAGNGHANRNTYLCRIHHRHLVLVPAIHARRYVRGKGRLAVAAGLQA